MHTNMCLPVRTGLTQTDHSHSTQQATTQRTTCCRFTVWQSWEPSPRERRVDCQYTIFIVYMHLCSLSKWNRKRWAFASALPVQTTTELFQRPSGDNNVCTYVLHIYRCMITYAHAWCSSSDYRNRSSHAQQRHRGAINTRVSVCVYDAWACRQHMSYSHVYEPTSEPDRTVRRQKECNKFPVT